MMQTYNDGQLTLYRVRESAPYGRVREEDLVPVESYLRFARRKTGMSRFWAGFAAGERIQRMVRIPLRRGRETPANAVVRLSGDKAYYTVLQSQPDPEGGWEDLTLGVLDVDKG